MGVNTTFEGQRHIWGSLPHLRVSTPESSRFSGGGEYLCTRAYSEFMVHGLWFLVSSLGFMEYGFIVYGLWFYSLWFMVSRLMGLSGGVVGFRISISGFPLSCSGLLYDKGFFVWCVKNRTRA